MPKVTVKLEEGTKSFDVETGKRLVLALEDNEIDVSHRCGGWARCTTCRCSVFQGEPQKITKAEKERIATAIERGDEGMKNARLSCQILVTEDMTVTPLKRVKNEKWDDPGKRPEDNITPDPEWMDIAEGELLS